jgi:hypothetical protein
MSRLRVHYLNPVAKHCKKSDTLKGNWFSNSVWYYSCGLTHDWGSNTCKTLLTEDFSEVTCKKCLKDEPKREVGFRYGTGYRKLYIDSPEGVLWVDRIKEV